MRGCYGSEVADDRGECRSTDVEYGDDVFGCHGAEHAQQPHQNAQPDDLLARNTARTGLGDARLEERQRLDNLRRKYRVHDVGVHVVGQVDQKAVAEKEALVFV